MLAPSEAEQLADRVAALTRTRAEVLDAHGAELRRIERDLHDGTQARLVAIAMRLAVARQALPDDPQVVAKLLRDAHEGTEEAMTELRDVIRTIYPPILADRGLAGAVRTVAARAGVPTQVDLDTLPDVPAAVQVAAYFAVTESLTNIAKHGRATRASVRLQRAGSCLSIDALNRVAGGGTALDPDVVAELLTRRADPVAALTRREREILALMVQGHDNTTIASTLFVTDNAVHKHIGNIFSKLGLAVTDSGHRRVLAVLAYLNGRSGAADRGGR
jgi:DNA-binding NarL/FixJ family response regulator